MSCVDPATAHILEIGSHAIMKAAFPDRTTLLWTYRKLSHPLDVYQPFSLRAARRAWRDMRAHKIDLVVVWVDPYPPWSYRQLKAIVEQPLHPIAGLIR